VRRTRLAFGAPQGDSAPFEAKTVIEGEAPAPVLILPQRRRIPLLTPLADATQRLSLALDRRVRHWFPHAPRYLVGSLAITTAAFLVITAVAAGKLTYDRFFGPGVAVPAGDVHRGGRVEVPPAILTTEDFDGAYAAVQDYLAADGWRAKLAYVRHPDKTAPRMEEHYSRPEFAGGDTSKRADHVLLQKKLVGERHHIIVLAVDVYPDATTGFFVVEKLPGGGFLVDWESSSGYQPVPLAEFKASRPTDPVPFRVQVSRGDYYNYGFTEDAFDCYRLHYPNDPAFELFAYAAKGGPVATELDLLVPPGSQASLSLSLVLELAYAADAQADNQVEIARVAATEWVED
jgi:hypothetical protein